MLPYWRKVLGAEDRIEDVDEERCRSHGKMLQGPIWDTVRAKSLADLKATDGFQNIVGVG
jgi:hypothetical protein